MTQSTCIDGTCTVTNDWSPKKQTTKRPTLPKIDLKLERVKRGSGDWKKSLDTPTTVVSFLEYMQDLPVEVFTVVFLNTRNEPLGYQEISRGTLSASLVHPREVFKAAILINAHSIICAHNHPSGSDLLPSADDMATTRTLYAVGRLIGINMIDHLILGFNQSGDDYYSFRENFPEIWNATND